MPTLSMKKHSMRKNSRQVHSQLAAGIRRGFRLGWWGATILLAAALAMGGCTRSPAATADGGSGLRVPGGISRLASGLCGLPGEVIVVNTRGEHFQLKKSVRGYRLEPLPACPPPTEAAIAGMLEDGIVGRGKLTIAKAWLAGPTERYDHGILGDAVEASELWVATEDGKLHSFTLDAGSVFEDLHPRVVDLEGDGPEEVLLVRSRLGAGASTALFGVENGELKLLAESKPFGRPNRWLNPVGVADFDGDGKREIAVVVTPHIGGSLVLYGRKGNRLVQKHSIGGFSNHAIGSRELGMSAVLDLNLDGVPDMAVPGADRESLRIVTFAGGKFAELRRHTYDSEIVTAIELGNFGVQIRPDIVFGLEDGSLVVLAR